MREPPCTIEGFLCHLSFVKVVRSAAGAGHLIANDRSMARFLVVDDEINALSALRELLESDGHQVAAVSSALEASAALKASAFDVVMTDLEIPHGEGDAVVKLTRQYQPAACVFVATARRAPRRLEQAGHVLENPLDYERITRAVAACRTDEISRGQGRRCLKSAALAIG